jgi:FtsH-binding integral membrane protein
MAFQPNNYSGRTFIADTQTFDQGLRRHMIGVYNYMLLGLVLTGASAFFVHNDIDAQAFVRANFFVVAMAPLAFILVLSFGIRRMSAMAAQLTFYAYSAVMGLSLSTLLMQYQAESIGRVFFITAGMFGATSLYGYTTRKSLTGMGSFMMMGLLGLIIASVVNMFMHSSLLQMALSYVAVVVFTGLTAFDTQRIRDSYSEGYGVESNGKLAIMGALTLYLDFINLFVSMMRLMGNRR